MPADIHFSAFIVAFLALIEHGMKYTPVMCKYTVSELQKQRGNVDLIVRTNLQYQL